MPVRWCRFVARHRLLTALLTVALMLPCAVWASRVTLSSKLTDYYPGRHPHVRLYQDFTEMLKMTNAVVVTVTVREGVIYTPETLGKIHRMTVDLLATRGVNPFEVLSLTHPRLKDIKVRSEGISILPLVDHPDQPQTAEQLVRIARRNAHGEARRQTELRPSQEVVLCAHQNVAQTGGVATAVDRPVGQLQDVEAVDGRRRRRGGPENPGRDPPADVHLDDRDGDTQVEPVRHPVVREQREHVAVQVDRQGLDEQVALELRPQVRY